MVNISYIAVAAVLFVSLVSAHPGAHKVSEGHHLAMTKRATEFHERCSDHISKRSMEHHDQLRVQRRNLNTAPLASGHFNTTCVLTPEVTQGPFYRPAEAIRSNITERQPGVPLVLDLLVMDINTCEPLPNVAVDVWHCNSTGKYSGYTVEGTDEETFLRGVQITDKNGAVQFDSIFPGWYGNRAVHIHMMVHANGFRAENGSYAGGDAIHTGQIFFAQDLIDQIVTISPYSSSMLKPPNTIDDLIFQQENSGGYNAYASYQNLHHSLEQGLLAWITLGVDLTCTDCDGSGGVGGGGLIPSGSMPSGMSSGSSPPSGSMPVPTSSSS